MSYPTQRDMQRRRRAIQMRRYGWSYGEMAEALGVSKTRAWVLANKPLTWKARPKPRPEPAVPPRRTALIALALAWQQQHGQEARS